MTSAEPEPACDRLASDLETGSSGGSAGEHELGVRADRAGRLYRPHWRDRRFWTVQALVMVIASSHIALEIGGSLLGWPSLSPALYLVPVTMFFIPVIYATMFFGERGAMLTVAWCWILSLPTIVLYHRHSEQVGVNLQLAIMLITALLVGGRVDRERRAAFKAADVSAQLRELDATAIAASRSLDLQRVFADTLHVIARRSEIGSAWIVYAPDGWESRSVTARSDSPQMLNELPARRLSATRHVIAEGEPWTGGDAGEAAPATGAEQTMVIVPVTAGSGVAGALGVAGPSAGLPANEVEQLGAIGRQLGLAVDNIQHFEDAQRALREVASSQAALRTYVELAAEAQEEERKRLARELHDETIQALVVVRGDLEAKRALNEPNSARRAVTIATLDHIIAELRRYCRDLRPSILDDLGLAQALDALTLELVERSGIEVDLRCEDGGLRLDARTELILYRIAQEALRNVERHSDARHAAVTLAVCPDSVTLRVTDDGRGFDPADGDARLAEAGHLGLLGMNERTRSLGGALKIESSPGAGTCVEVWASRE